MANSATDNVTILRNNGSGNFNPIATSPETVGDFPLGMVAADLDGDGDQDLAVANQAGGTVTILRNTGHGDFVEPASSPVTVGTSPQSVAAADFDGDGDKDLAVANSGSANVTILKNRGSANFVERSTSPEATGVTPFFVVAGDLDGDLDADLAVVNISSANVTILKNKGAGDFVEPASSPEGSMLSFPNSVVAADLDDDGDRDLAVACQGTDNVRIFRNNGAANFNEVASSPEAVGDTPVFVAAADFDKDGDQDLAVADQDADRVTILRNRGTADFVEPLSSPETPGDGPVWVAIADLDGDLDSDLAISNRFSHNVTILLNR